MMPLFVYATVESAAALLDWRWRLEQRRRRDDALRRVGRLMARFGEELPRGGHLSRRNRRRLEAGYAAGRRERDERLVVLDGAAGRDDTTETRSAVLVATKTDTRELIERARRVAAELCARAAELEAGLATETTDVKTTRKYACGDEVRVPGSALMGTVVGTIDEDPTDPGYLVNVGNVFSEAYEVFCNESELAPWPSSTRD